MVDEAHIRELRDKRASLSLLLAPLEARHPIAGDSQPDKVRMRFLQREIAELDGLIAREQDGSGA